MIRRIRPGRMVLSLLDIVYPARCAVCDDIAPAGRRVCAACANVFRPLRGPLCATCGKELSDAEDVYCTDCLRVRHAFDRGFSLFSYRDVAPSLYRFKYMGRQEYAEYFAERFVAHYGGLPEGIRVDALVPVPVSARRLTERGYNQAERLARALSARLDIPVRCDLIARVRDTKPQKLLDYYGRLNNLKNAFIMKKNDVSLKSVALVDDIYTTGSTADEIACLLKRHGMRFVYVFTPAIGKLQGTKKWR